MGTDRTVFRSLIIYSCIHNFCCIVLILVSRSRHISIQSLVQRIHTAVQLCLVAISKAFSRIHPTVHVGFCGIYILGETCFCIFHFLDSLCDLCTVKAVLHPVTFIRDCSTDRHRLSADIALTGRLIQNDTEFFIFLIDIPYTIVFRNNSSSNKFRHRILPSARQFRLQLLSVYPADWEVLSWGSQGLHSTPPRIF